MRKVDFEQGSQEWLDWRKGLLTATDAAMLLGVSPYVTPYKGWQRKVGQAPEQQENDAMRRGKRDEPIARDLFVKEYGIEMTPYCVESDQYNFIGSSLDGMSDCGKYILEIKSQRPVDAVPEFHMHQMQHQLLSTDNTAEKCFYVSHWEGVNKTFEVYPDPEWKKNYIPKAQAFWKCVVFFEAPPLSCKDYRDMTGAVTWDGYAVEYRKLVAQIKVLEELKDSYKQELIKLCGDDSCAGSGIKVLKKVIKGRIDYKEACEVLNIRDDMLAPYKKADTMSWTIMLDQK
jgi:putative phage-type endonuclease